MYTFLNFFHYRFYPEYTQELAQAVAEVINVGAKILESIVIRPYSRDFKIAVKAVICFSPKADFIRPSKRQQEMLNCQFGKDH